MGKSHDAILDVIKGQLEAGTIPWRKTWNMPRPRNADNRSYSGINYFLLSFSGYEDPRWMTFNKAQSLGGCVKKGEKGKHIVFFNFLEKTDSVSNAIKKMPILRIYSVFNLAQVEGVELPQLGEEKKVEAESIVKGYRGCPKIEFGFESACYFPSQDRVNMPSLSQFGSRDEYYSVLFHELAHSTGAKDRLNRKGIVNFDKFGTEQYSEEELIAEMTAAFLCAEAGIDNTLQNTASYIKGWLKFFDSNPNVLVSAASKAQKAANYILNKTEIVESE